MTLDEMAAFYRSEVPGSRAYLLIRSPDGGVMVVPDGNHSDRVGFGAYTDAALTIGAILDGEIRT